ADARVEPKVAAVGGCAERGFPALDVANRVRHVVDERVAGLDPAARELTAGPREFDGVVTEPGVAGADGCDGASECVTGVTRVFTELNAHPAFCDEQVGNAAGPVAGAHGADRDGVGEPVVAESGVCRGV